MSVTRTYLCTTLDREYTVEQRITDGPLKECILCPNLNCVPKRLISDSKEKPHLISGDTGGWSETGYSKRPHERKAERVLGRKLVKAAR